MKLLNSALVTVPGGLVCRGEGIERVRITVRYGLICRPNGRLSLVDTGYGRAVTEGARSTALRLYDFVLRPRLIPAASPAAALAAAGATPGDVESIVLTHFHADHIAGLRDFPDARLVANGRAAASILGMSHNRALHNGVFKELLPADLSHRIAPVEQCASRAVHPVLGSGHDVFGDGSYWAVPLPGHALGHFGLYWDAPEGPTLYATDAAWTTRALRDNRTPALSRRIVFDDCGAGTRTEDKLRQFIREGGTVHLCHDLETG